MHLNKPIDQIMQEARSGRCVIPATTSVSEDWLHALGSNYSVRYVYRISTPDIVVPRTSGSSPFSQKALGADDCDLFINHFDRVCHNSSIEISFELSALRKRFPTIWDNLEHRCGYFSANSIDILVGSLLLIDSIPYPELGIDSCRVVAWWGYDSSQVSAADSVHMKMSWMKKIHEAACGEGDIVALVHHRNARGRRFTERLGFRIVGVFVRWEEK